ncbi:MAG: 4-(cytidine 5'-diphospho)-2-C-methyl-D-erythritol kinase [Acidaminococcaceae bacterium]|nr:4-(cytidine 5'-diphospho)-2-C-methyl-D-erythritol kinase [Acidaminococcaceae bacterium]
MEEKAYAKINLGLNVLGKRCDGYHDVDMIMQTISLADEVELTEAESFLLTTDDADLACDESNLAWKAANLMGKLVNRKPNVHIHIKKQIFVAAGLAGGSSDGAAVLRGLNKLWKIGFSVRQLEAFAAQLGSDVPFCISGGTTRATGRGEILKALPDMPIMWLVLVKPKNMAVSTSWVYKNLGEEVEQIQLIDNLEKAIKIQDGASVLKNLGNVLESVTIPVYPLIGEIKDTMLKVGALAALMSGSGPTVFGVTADKNTAEKIASIWQGNREMQITVARTIQRSENP